MIFWYISHCRRPSSLSPNISTDNISTKSPSNGPLLVLLPVSFPSPPPPSPFFQFWRYYKCTKYTASKQLPSVVEIVSLPCWLG